MNKHNIAQLQSTTNFPSISIIIPTHMVLPDKLQNPILLKDCIKQAAKELQSKVPGNIAEPLIDKLHKLEQYIDFSKTSKSLALFVNKDVTTFFYLPWTLPKTVLVDEQFAVRDILVQRAKSPSYWILALSRGSTRLLHFSDDHLYEIIEPTVDKDGKPVSGFPLNDLGPSEHKYLAIGTGDLDARYKDNHEIQFFRFIDTNFARFLKQEVLPVILLGVAEDIAYFKDATHNKDSIVESVHGNFDHATLDHIKDAIKPAIERDNAKKVAAALKKLDEAVSALKSASDIEPVWHMAVQGRVHLLLIERNFDVAGVINPENPDEIAVTGTHANSKSENVIEQLIETVHAKGGDVIFVEPGTLKDHNRIAAILRF